MRIQEIEDFNPYDIHDLAEPTNPEVQQVQQAKHLAKILKANCRGMVVAYQKSKQRLFRGVSNLDIGTTPDSIITAIRPDREPLEMGEEEHAVLHQAFLDIGLKATRTNSIFCSTNRSLAGDWGEPYVIFVKDGWSGTVFAGVKDDYVFQYASDLAEDYLDDGNRVKFLKRLRKLKPMVISNTNTLVSVLNERYEDILITGDSYIGIHAKSKLYSNVANILHLI